MRAMFEGKVAIWEGMIAENRSDIANGLLAPERASVGEQLSLAAEAVIVAAQRFADMQNYTLAMNLIDVMSIDLDKYEKSSTASVILQTIHRGDD
jgi:hypothetical protein